MEIISSQQNIKGHAGKFIPSTHKSLYAALGFSVCMLATGFASAASVTIDDRTETITVATDLIANVQITQEAIGVLGAADLHFEYFSNDSNVPVPGQVSVINYNIFGFNEIVPGDHVLSDTLSITLTGHTPTSPTDANNVSVDMHFRSNSIDDILPPALANGINIDETGGFQVVNSGLSDLNVQFASDTPDVPVPAAAWLFGTGLIGLAGASRKRKAV